MHAYMHTLANEHVGAYFITRGRRARYHPLLQLLLLQLLAFRFFYCELPGAKRPASK